MLYWLSSLAGELSAFNIFRYITFRTGGALITALLFVFLFGPAIIRSLRIRQGKGQPIRTDGPERHLLSEARHADHGRVDDPFRGHRRHAALGQSAKPLCLGGAHRHPRLWRRRPL